MNSQGEKASVELHKNCYCSYTSKQHVKQIVAQDGSIDSEEAPVARMRRSQVKDFDFKEQCLFCAEACEPVNPKHPERWDRVVECERKGVKDTPPFKTVVVQHCDVQYLLEMRALPAPEAKTDIVCRHHDGYWNAVSADQFGEQTAIKIGKGALKGTTLSAELVAEWIDAFPITVHVSDRVDHIYMTHQENLHRNNTRRS